MKQKNPECLFDFKFGKSVSSAYYSPLTGNRLVLTSLDDRLRCEGAHVYTWVYYCCTVCMSVLVLYCMYECISVVLYV